MGREERERGGGGDGVNISLGGMSVLGGENREAA